MSSPGKPKVLSKVLVFLDLARPPVVTLGAPPPNSTTKFALATHILSRPHVSGPTTTHRMSEKALNVAAQNLKTKKSASDLTKDIFFERDSRPKAAQMTLLGSTDF